MMLTWENSANAAMVMVIRMKVRVWRRPGQVTLTNCCHGLAPSIEAAS